MIPTVEVRWFFEGRVPPKVLRWFCAGDRMPDEPAPRVDCYLRSVDTDALGIKLREGRIEIKQRHDKPDLVRLHARVAGQVEGWRKWSFELARSESVITNTPLLASAWVAVQKKRSLRKYRVLGDGQVLAMPAADAPGRGCNLELTQLTVEARAWWTLAFEAFGGASALQADLLCVARHVLAVHEPPVFDVQDSFGYPQWLGMIGPATDHVQPA